MTDLTIWNNDVKLAASVHGSSASEPVLFLHGITNSRDTWLEAADALRDRYWVWTLDFRGHGHSDRAPSYELHDYVSDVQAVLSAIGRPAIGLTKIWNSFQTMAIATKSSTVFST